MEQQSRSCLSHFQSPRLSLLISVFIILALPAEGLAGVLLLGNEIFAPVEGQAQGGAFSEVEDGTSRVTFVEGPEGRRPADFSIVNRGGRAYVDPRDIGQVFPGTTVRRRDEGYTLRRRNGQRLNLQIQSSQILIIFLGMIIDINMRALNEGDGSYLPLNDLGQFYGRQFSPSGSGLRVGPVDNSALDQSWQQTISDMGYDGYDRQIQDAAAATRRRNQGDGRVSSQGGRVFEDITATVFSSVESGLKGAYGEYLRPNDMYVALPDRFNGERPRVAVRGPSGTVVAEIKDVGPWNIDDPYWESGRRPQAESGRDSRGRRTNLAGIDLSPAMGRRIGIDGKGKVDWWFVE